MNCPGFQPTLSRLEMRSPGFRSALWSAWVWSGSCAVGARAAQRRNHFGYRFDFCFDLRPAAAEILQRPLRHDMYHPLLIFEGGSGILLASVLDRATWAVSAGLCGACGCWLCICASAGPSAPLRCAPTASSPSRRCSITLSMPAACMPSACRATQTRGAGPTAVPRRAEAVARKRTSRAPVYRLFDKAGTRRHPRRFAVKRQVTALGTNVRFDGHHRVLVMLSNLRWTTSADRPRTTSRN